MLAGLVEKQLTVELFHNDVTGWKVFKAIEPRNLSCSRFLSQALDSTALPKNTHTPMGESKIF